MVYIVDTMNKREQISVSVDKELYRKVRGKLVAGDSKFRTFADWLQHKLEKELYETIVD